MTQLTKKNPVAASLRDRQFHQRIVVSKKLYVRHKEKVKTHAQTQKGE